MSHHWLPLYTNWDIFLAFHFLSMPKKCTSQIYKNWKSDWYFLSILSACQSRNKVLKFYNIFYNGQIIKDFGLNTALGIDSNETPLHVFICFKMFTLFLWCHHFLSAYQQIPLCGPQLSRTVLYVLQPIWCPLPKSHPLRTMVAILRELQYAHLSMS